MEGYLEAIFIAPEAGAPMQPVSQIEVVQEGGLQGDRYFLRAGRWGDSSCQVTLIQAEDLEEVEKQTGIRLAEGQHRRNLVIRGVPLASLQGKRFQVGEVLFEYEKPCPPCSYLESLTQPGMKASLSKRGGICARVLRSGWIRRNDPVHLVESARES